MNTASALFEVYRALPKRIKKEFKNLIEHEDEMTLMQEIEEGLKEVKLMKEGKIPSRTFSDLKKERQDAK